MNCPTPDLLEQLVDDLLSDEVRDQLLEHLDHCPACQQALDSSGMNRAWRNSLSTLNIQADESPMLEQAIANVRSSLDPWQPVSAQASSTQGISSDALAWTNDGFELLSVLGQGGMGIVFKARETSLNRTVAIKVLLPALAAEPSARERFLREARAAAAINHPNVVTIHAVSDKPPLPYLVMECVEGHSLQKQLDAVGSLDTQEVVRIGKQVVAALAAAHAKGVLHRDIKPANIFLEGDSGQVKLGDFGLAQVAGESQLTRAGSLAGTPAFIAPENLDAASKPDQRADLFSLGSLLYVLCCGKLPFDGGTPIATLHQVANSNPIPIEQQCPTIPSWLASVIEKLHVKNPAERFQSAADLQAALDAQQAELILPRQTVLSRLDRNSSESGRVAKKIGFAAIVASAVLLALLTLPAFFGAKDFVVLDGEGNRVGAYAELTEAIEVADEGARIEIQGDGPYLVQSLTVQQQSLTLAAAKDSQPVLQFESDAEFNEEDDYAFISAEGDLQLQGIEFVYAGDEEDEPRGLVEVMDGAFVADRCHFFVAPGGYCIVASMEHHVEITECELRSDAGEAVELLPGPTGAAEFTDCSIFGEVAITIPVIENCEVVLTGCTLRAFEAIKLLEEEVELSTSTMSFVVEDTTFEVEEGMLAINTPQLDREAFASMMTWTGTGNTFSGQFILVGQEEDYEVPQWCTSFDDWQTIVSETESDYSEEPFEMELD